MSDNLDFAGKCPFDSPNSRAPLDINTVFEITNDYKGIGSLSQMEEMGRDSLSILDISQLDLGRESLGISGFNEPNFARQSLRMFDSKNPDTRRDTLTFLEMDFGRESLGIINNLDLARDSLVISNIKTSNFLSSIAILPDINNTKSCDISPSKVLPKIAISKAVGDNCKSLLDTEFLTPLSTVNSNTSLYPSFNTASLESICPSKIYSSISTNGSRDILNYAFQDTTDFLQTLQMQIRPASSSIYSDCDKNCQESNLDHRRIKSLPTALEEHLTPKSEFVGSDLDKAFIEQPENNNDDYAFNDSVFIEANHIAFRIADGSFLVPDANENDMLDSFQEPDDFKYLITEDDHDIKLDTETVFKTIDRMFQVSNSNQNLPEEQNVSDEHSEVHERYNRSCHKSSSSSAKDPLEIINSLSEILKSENPDAKQKCEGQNLLSSLAEILLSSASTKSRSCVLDDSGHSSIDSEPANSSGRSEMYEVLDLRKKSCSETNIHVEPENCTPLDLSMKSKNSEKSLDSSLKLKSFASPKILPPKFNKVQKSFATNSNHSLTSNCSLSSNDSKNSNDLTNKFKPKKTESGGVKRGPMKAVIPVDNMSRRSNATSKITPKRSESASNSKMKKTSTPINDSGMRPMAQSTPDNPKISLCPTSPLARPNTAQGLNVIKKQKLNYSGTNVPIKKESTFKSKSSSLVRRGSSGDLKREEKIAKPLLRRSYTAESKFSSKTSNVTKNNSTRNSAPCDKSISVLQENKNNKSLIGRFPVSKRNGKENVF